MPRYEISLYDIINLRDCSHYLRRAIDTCLLNDQIETKKMFDSFVDKLDGVVVRILASPTEGNDAGV
jgi:hypothetical protein